MKNPLYVHVSRVAQHHVREGHLLTQTQEEMILIGGFGLFWLGTYTSYPGLVLSALLSFPSLLSVYYTIDGNARVCLHPRIPGCGRSSAHLFRV